MSTKVTMQYHIKNDIDKETGRISLQSKIAGEFIEEIYETKDKQLVGALVRLGWLPPDDSNEVMTILNDFVRIGRHNDPETNMFREQFMLNDYKLLAKKVLNIESPVINRYIIRGKKNE